MHRPEKRRLLITATLWLAAIPPLAAAPPQPEAGRARRCHRGRSQGLTMTRRRTHPGKLLREELDSRQMSANQLALALRAPANRISAILRGERAVTAETAVRLGRYFETGPALRINLQSAYDVSVVESEKGRVIEREVLPASA